VRIETSPDAADDRPCGGSTRASARVRIETRPH